MEKTKNKRHSKTKGTGKARIKTTVKTLKKRPRLRMKRSGTVKQVGRRTHRKQANMRMIIGRISQVICLLDAQLV